ncbi:DUF6221 family protein [Streptomyces yangpuensis]|uniref:DUF6221 family protein n=1 Tax=Streptomyces yangpuensis TaxID=1648182 RepID=UPI0035E0851A
MDDLVQFLRARLDEDEQTARAAGGTWWAPPDLPGQVHDSGGINIEAKLPSFAAHIARHDPARVLAEVDAKRQILRRLEGAESTLGAAEKGTVPHDLMTGAVNSWRDAVRLLALPYADHPDYRQEWKP